jgi:hypothetical protein
MVSNSCPTVLFCYLCLDPPWLVNLLLTNWIDGRCSYRIRGFCFFPQPTLKFYAIIYANVYIYIYCTYIYIMIYIYVIYICYIHINYMYTCNSDSWISKYINSNGCRLGSLLNPGFLFGAYEAMRCQSMGSGGGFRWRKMIGKWMGKRSIYVVKTIFKKGWFMALF